MFYCREKELSDLNRRYQEGRLECAIVYGRRRVGKTALINEFCKDKPTIFFSALNATWRRCPEQFMKKIIRTERLLRFIKASRMLFRISPAWQKKNA